MLKGDSGDVKLDKGELCKLINAKYRDFKKRGKELTNEERIKAYEKNIDDCEMGESKGGYDKKELIEIAINYFNMNENEIKDMLKEDICKNIRAQIRQMNSDVIVPEKDTKEKLEYKLGDKNVKNGMIYPGDIALCNETPNRGGLSSKKVKQIAQEQFGIDTNHKHKEDICDEIADKLKNKKIIGRNKEGKEPRRETRLSVSKISKIKHSLTDLIGNNNDDEDNEYNEYNEDNEDNSILKNNNLAEILENDISLGITKEKSPISGSTKSITSARIDDDI
jgi:hypothetical protein